MTLDPGYGETPVPDDELSALLSGVRELLGDPVTRMAVYDLELAIAEEVAEAHILAVLAGTLTLDELLTDHFIRELHRKLYGEIWLWAGVFRKRELNIGVAPEQISMELRAALDTLRHRWEHTDDWSARELGVAAHADTVRIHPFTDGNGRSTRLLADLVFLAAQDPEAVAECYDWAVDKGQYITLLRDYDINRDPKRLAGFIPVRRLDDE